MHVPSGSPTSSPLSCVRTDGPSQALSARTLCPLQPRCACPRANTLQGPLAVSPHRAQPPCRCTLVSWEAPSGGGCLCLHPVGSPGPVLRILPSSDAVLSPLPARFRLAASWAISNCLCRLCYVPEGLAGPWGGQDLARLVRGGAGGRTQSCSQCLRPAQALQRGRGRWQRGGSVWFSCPERNLAQEAIVPTQ